MNGIDSE